MGQAIVGVGMANDWLREEFEGFKNFEKSVGSAIISGWESLTTKVGEFFMTERIILEESEKFNIIINKKILKGWLLIITEDNQEYLIKQNSVLLRLGKYKIKRKFYKVDGSLTRYKGSREEVKRLVDNQNKVNSFVNSFKVAIGLVIGAIIRNVLDKSFFYGNTNVPIEFLKGISNILLFWMMLLLCINYISIHRQRKIEKILKYNNNLSLQYIGIGYEEMRVEKNKNIPNLIIAAMFLIILTLIIVVLIPFLVELRLLSIILIIVFIAIYFNGSLVVKEDKSTFVINKKYV